MPRKGSQLPDQSPAVDAGTRTPAFKAVTGRRGPGAGLTFDSGEQWLGCELCVVHIPPLDLGISVAMSRTPAAWPVTGC